MADSIAVTMGRTVGQQFQLPSGARVQVLRLEMDGDNICAACVYTPRARGKPSFLLRSDWFLRYAARLNDSK